MVLAGEKFQMRCLLTAQYCLKILIVLIIGVHCTPAISHELHTPLLEELTKRIPDRSSHALTGSQFVDLTSKINEQQRERLIGEQLLDGNLPGFLKKLKPVKLQFRNKSGRLVKAVIYVIPDYLAIGSKDDFIRIPMDLYTASKVAKQFGFILPTRRMVDAIYEQSESHFTPQPLPPCSQMRSTGYYERHNQKIIRQQHSRGIALGELVSGHKKDVVITNRLLKKPGRIAIYGWHRPGGKPIQPLSTVHGAGYADYSHGIRLVSEKVLINGKLCSVYDILKDPELAFLLSDEGPLKEFKYSLDRIVLSANKRT